jgi:hypothetical protein
MNGGGLDVRPVDPEWYDDPWPDQLYRQARQHQHIYVVEAVLFCLAGCVDAHLDEAEGTHRTAVYYASTRERAEAYIRAHATTDPVRAWEVWERAIDAYQPYEEADDQGDLWQYAGDGTPLTPATYEARYQTPLYGWEPSA